MPMLKNNLCNGLNKEVVDALRRAGVRTVLQLVSSDLEELSKKSQKRFQELGLLRRLLLIQFSVFPINGLELYEEVLNTVAILSTGISSLDELLDGGVYTTEVTELVGSSRTGKTQVCLHTAVVVAMKMQKTTLHIDSGDSMCIERLADIMEQQGQPKQKAEAALCGIRCHQAFDVFSLLNLLEEIKDCLVKQTDVFYSHLKLLVVDSLASVLSPVLGDQHGEGRGLMMHVARYLKSLAMDHSIAVLVTNAVVYTDGVSRPTLGHAWQSIPNTRIELVLQDSFKVTGYGSEADVPPLREAYLIKSCRQKCSGPIPLNL